MTKQQQRPATLHINRAYQPFAAAAVGAAYVTTKRGDAAASLVCLANLRCRCIFIADVSLLTPVGKVLPNGASAAVIRAVYPRPVVKQLFQGCDSACPIPSPATAYSEVAAIDQGVGMVGSEDPYPVLE